jgi:hypothetical protein
VLQIFKRLVFHTGEYVWYCVLLPLGMIDNNQLYVNTYQTIMSGVSVAGNSFFLLGTYYLSKHAEGLKRQAKYLEYRKQNPGKKGVNDSVDDLTQDVQYLNTLCSAIYSNPGRTYMMLLICQALLCFIQLLYCSFRTQFLFPMIQTGLSVFVLWTMCGKKIY